VVKLQIISKKIERRIETFMDINKAEMFHKCIMAEIGKDKLEIAKFRENKGVYKKYKEEWLPIYFFMQEVEVYKGTKFRVVLGNQGYDGIIKIAESEKKVEVTTAIDGKKFMKDMKLLNNKGYSEVEVNDLFTAQFNKLKLIDSTVNKKEVKDYKDTILIVNVDGFPEFGFEEKEELKLINNYFNRKFSDNIAEIYILFLNLSSGVMIIKLK